jgi:hypothetical protein
MTSVRREAVPARRDQTVLATGANRWIVWHTALRRTLECRLHPMRPGYR